jgi:hypothetical protein
VFGGGTTADPLQDFTLVPADCSGAQINLRRESPLPYEVIEHGAAKAGQFQDFCYADNFG